MPVARCNRRDFFRRKSESAFLLQVSCGLPGRIPTEQKSACPPLSDIDANPDANGDGTKRAWLDRTENKRDTGHPNKKALLDKDDTVSL